MRTLSSFLLAPVFAGSVAACSVYDPALAECTVDTIGCLPSPPARDDPSDGGDMELLFALDHIQLAQTALPGLPQPWRTIGLNLDRRNTVDSDNVECQLPDSTASIPRDGENGIDNVFGANLWTFVSTALPNLPNEICCWHDRGRGTILLRIQDWNGTANDRQVRISILFAADGTPAAAGDVMWDSMNEHGLVLVSNPSTPAPKPTWTPDTTGWYASLSAFASPEEERALHYSDNAYIRDGMFVMPLAADKTVDLFTGTGSVRMVLKRAHLFGRMNADFTRIVSGAVAGRMAYDDLLLVSSSIGQCTRDPAGQLNVLGQQVTSVFASNADVFADPASPPANGVCDAISLGVAFRGVRGLWRGVAPEKLCFPNACDMNASACATLQSDQDACAASTCPAHPTE